MSCTTSCGKEPFMTRLIVSVGSFSLLFCSTVVGSAAPIQTPTIDWRPWQNLPVESGGRHKPLDTLAAETLLETSDGVSVIDSDVNQVLNPTALYLTMLFEWTGWDHKRADEFVLAPDAVSQYAYLHQPDRWDKTALLRVDHPGLKQVIGLPEHVRFVTPATLATTSVIDQRTQRNVPFATWGRMLQESKDAGKTLSVVEEQGLELAHRLKVYQSERMGIDLGIVPGTKPGEVAWLSAGALLLTKFDDTKDPQGEYRRAQSLLREARSAFRNGDTAKFNACSAKFRSAIQAIISAAPGCPSQSRIDLEVDYNHWEPFHCAWACLFASTAAMLLHMRSHWRAFYWGAVGAYSFGMLALLVGFLLRVVISGRPPVTNMYESVVFVGAGMAALGALFGTLYRQAYVLTAAAGVSTVMLMVATGNPSVLDPSIRPLEPVLRSNFWLVAHVMTVTLSYAAFALALGIANITLSCCGLRATKIDLIRTLTRLTNKAIQAGVVLLACGIVLGAVWADYSWGRFWDWDPKEVWALITLLGYLGVLHAQHTGALGHRGFALLSILCFSLVVMAWYGVNFLLGVGLHTYGFGSGGQGVVYLAVLGQSVFAGVAFHRSQMNAHLIDEASTQTTAVDPRPVMLFSTTSKSLNG